MFALVAVRVFEMPCRWPIHITSMDADIVAGVGNLHACFISALVAVRDVGLPCRWFICITSLAADIVAGVRTDIRDSCSRLLLFVRLVCLVAGYYALPRSLLTWPLV